MANIRSAKKRVRITKTKTMRNKMIKSNIKTVLKTADTTVATGEANKEEAVRLAIKKIDQAAAKGIFHKNKADRKKSQLQKMLNQANA